MRYTGPKMKLCRREGKNLFGSDKYTLAKNNRAPLGRSISRLSLYGQQLRAKQSTKRVFGVSEKQFSNYYKKAAKLSGNTVDNMKLLLETRLDVAILRANFARTIMQARQFVNHGHFLVNGVRVNIPSYAIKAGDIIEIRENKKDSPLYKGLVTEFEEFLSENSSGSVTNVDWLSVDSKKLIVTIDHLPEAKDFDQSLDVSKIVEFYSK